jgi:hypothetical protein
MAKKKVCVSFDYTKDKKHYFMLKAWDANEKFDFSFNDCTPEEIETESVPVIKAGLTRKINESNYMLVLVGEDANKKHPDSDEIGYKNWQNFEVAKAVEAGCGMVAVKLGKYEYPEELLDVDAEVANSFTEDAILEALKNA